MSVSPDLIAAEDAAILAATTHAYQATANKYNLDPATVHRMRACHAVSRFMVDHLVEVAGHEATSDNRGYHEYVELPATGRIADATWQQHLPEGTSTDNLPKVLIGTRGDVVEQARAHGVRYESDLDTWRPRKNPPGQNSRQIVVPPVGYN
jgi:hypothetical protein